MKIGGKISRFYAPETIDEFIQIIQKEPRAFIAGNLSNVIISSFGYDGAVISTKNFLISLLMEQNYCWSRC